MGEVPLWVVPVACVATVVVLLVALAYYDWRTQHLPYRNGGETRDALRDLGNGDALTVVERDTFETLRRRFHETD